MIKETKFKITFHLTIFLHKFLSESLIRQGHYFINVSLIPISGIYKTNHKDSKIK
jgi:hypothetical protein